MISPLEISNLENCNAIYVLLSQYMLSQPTITKPIQLKVQDNAKAKNGPHIWNHCKSLMIMLQHTYFENESTINATHGCMLNCSGMVE